MTRRTMISTAEAEALVRRSVRPFPEESRSLKDAAGCFLRQDVRADRDYPPANLSAMDGVALAYDAWKLGRRRFRVVGVQRAGIPAIELASPEETCVEVMTGAVLPAGTDCVVPVEVVRREGTTATVPDEGLSRWDFVRRRGRDAREGRVVLQAGVPLTPPRLALLAAMGRDPVRVARRPSIAVVGTGDELVPVRSQGVRPHQIRRSNALGVRALLAANGFSGVRCLHLRDEARILRRRLGAILSGYDVVLLCGGVSMGRFDLVPEVLSDLGVRRVFHKVRQRPGKPLWFGLGEGGRPVFGLPGNPVSSMVCARRYVLPWLEAAGRGRGEAPSPRRAVLREAVSMPEELTLFLPVRLRPGGDGREDAFPVPLSGSGDFIGLAEADGIAELPVGRNGGTPGRIVPVYPWRGW